MSGLCISIGYVGGCLELRPIPMCGVIGLVCW